MMDKELKIFKGVDEYNEKIGESKVICIDFDSTVVVEEWPFVGRVLTGAIEVIKKLISKGHKIILFTQRSPKNKLYSERFKEFIETYPQYYFEENGEQYVDTLSIALDVFEQNGIELFDYNANNIWESITDDKSRKVFADYVIDDHNVGMKLNVHINRYGEKVKCCDWEYLDEFFVNERLYGKYAINY